MLKLKGGQLVGKLNWQQPDDGFSIAEHPAHEVARREAICRACERWDASKNGCGLLRPCLRHDLTRTLWRRGACRLGKFDAIPEFSMPSDFNGGDQTDVWDKLKAGQSTRGIVTSAGGPLYFLNAYLNCCLLREKGCTLPIEWCFLGAEMQPRWLQAVERISNVKLIDLGGEQLDNSKGRGGWQSKIEAILASRFQEVLFLDADCFPRRDPAYLFDDSAYRDTGVVLWGDVMRWEADRAAYLNERFGVTLPSEQIESGQLLFDKSRAMPLLEEVRRLHQLPDIYRVVFGDKDTFLLAALRTKTAFRLQPQNGFIPGGIVQRDFQGNPIFSHLTNGKFRWGRRPRTTEDALPGIGSAIGIMQELADFLGGMPELPPGEGKAEADARRHRLRDERHRLLRAAR